MQLVHLEMVCSSHICRRPENDTIEFPLCKKIAHFWHPVVCVNPSILWNS